ncbi:MAG TPA: YtxH domain-containing protein [Acidobacteriaceae bacterium]
MSTWKFWAAFGVGLAAGAALALIYAPQTGERTRRQLRRGYEDASDYVRTTASTVSEQAGKYVKRGKDMVGDVVDSAQNIASAAKRVASFG